MELNDLLNVVFHVNVVPSGPHKFSGYFGPHEFVEGHSVTPVSLREALRLGASVELVDDDGMQVTTANYEALIAKHKVEPVVEVVEVVPEPVVEPVVEPVAPVVTLRVYTQVELEEIADKKGIAGLREIADLLNVKGRSIPEMITLIMHKQRNS